VQIDFYGDPTDPGAVACPQNACVLNTSVQHLTVGSQLRKLRTSEAQRWSRAESSLVL
jgi:hypothetical protein